MFEVWGDAWLRRCPRCGQRLSACASLCHKSQSVAILQCYGVTLIFWLTVVAALNAPSPAY
jgi:hypothetical protein